MIYSLSRQVPVLFGVGAWEQTGMKVSELGCRRVICVSDKGVCEAGITANVVENLEASGVETVLFDRSLPDPPDYIIEECTRAARDAKVDGIVGIGGGSSLDTAKAVNLLLGNPPPLSRYFEEGTLIKPGITMVLIPTTAGTGSEVSPVTVVTDTQNKQKQGIIGPCCIADLAIVDPSLTENLPAQITAIAGMDTLSHGMEALTSLLANPVSDIFAEKSIALTTDNLPAVVKGGGMDERTNMSLASMIAGISFSDALPHLGHAIAESLGAAYHVPHGVACAAVLPGVINFVADEVPDRVKMAGEAMGLRLKGMPDRKIGRAVAGAIRRLGRDIGIPTLKDAGADKQLLEEVVDNTLKHALTGLTPKKVSRDDIFSLLDEAFKES